MMIKYQVLGMTCGGCASSVTKAIEAASPGVSIEVDLDAKSIAVDGAAEGVIKQAVEDAGFEFVGAI